MTMFCAYVHARPTTVDATGIFYVGKGRARRAQDLSHRNPHHANVVAKYGAENILFGKIECSSEEVAFELEKGLIKCLRRMGVQLTNQTDGGEGVSGLVFSEESKAKISKAGLGRRFSEEHKAKIGDAGRGRTHSEESKVKISEARRGVPSPRKGVSLSEAIRQKIRAANLGKRATPITIEKLSKARKGRVHANNGVRTIRVLASEIPEGFIKGRLTVGKIWVNDGIISRQVFPHEIPEGFTKGRLLGPQRVKSARAKLNKTTA